MFDCCGCNIITVTIGVAIFIYLFRLFVQGPFYRNKNRIDGKVVIITGCNTGIGKETALEMAKRGAKVYMACRNSEKCEEARKEIIEESKNDKVYNRTLDLTSLDSVRKFANEFLREETRLDILIANAGIMGVPKGETKDGFEQHFGVNHLAHFLLINLLLDRLKATAPSRIVVVSSSMHYMGDIDKEDLMYEKTPYSGLWKAYPRSKLANVLFTKKLSKMLKGTGVTVNCLHPGSVHTDLQRHAVTTNLRQMIATPIYWLFFKTPKAGAQTSIRLALDPGMEGVSGNYYHDVYLRLPVIPKANDEKLADWLWEKSEQLIEEAKKGK